MSKKYEELTIRDPFMFGKVTTNKENCQGIISSLLDEEIEVDDYSQREKFIQARKGGKFVKLDLFMIDSKHRLFDAEMQNKSKNTTIQKELPFRSRYYQSMIDSEFVDSGEDYMNMFETYIIFICTYDLFGFGKYKYTFVNQCIEIPGLLLDDKSIKIFYNTTADLTDAPAVTKAFFNYIERGEVSNEITKKLEKSVQAARENEEWGHEYMLTFVHDMDVRKEGRAEGRAEEIAIVISNIKDTVNKLGPIDNVIYEKISNINDMNELLKIYANAVKAESVEEFAKTILDL